MDTQTLELLGLSKEELQTRVIDQICERILSTVGVDDEGVSHACRSRLHTQLEARMKKQIDDALNDFAAKFVVPGISGYLETLMLKPTSSYGERKGEPQTFLEYLTKRAGDWLSEKVNEKGKTHAEENYSWKEWGTRGAWLVDAQLKDRITKLICGGINDTHAAVANAVLEQVKAALQRTATTIQVTASTVARA